jgi:uncharacterized membrane protein YfcA
MGGATAAFLVVTAFLTATLSGVFGMAGGLVLMGALAFLMPVSVAFVTHGILQLVANGWRAILHRKHIAWPVLGWFLIAALLAAGFISLFTVIPSKFTLFLLLGLVPLVVWLPTKWVELDAAKPAHALIFGTLTSTLNLTAGVAGPLLDILFVRTGLTRHQIVATKAAIQSLNHVAKIIVYGSLLAASGRGAMPPWWLFALAIPASMLGTAVGGQILDRMSDVNFKRWTAWIVTAIGCVYLVKAAQLWP